MEGKYEIVGMCMSCPLRERRVGQVTSVRIPNGEVKEPVVLFLGESPGPVELTTGLPFTGKSGEILDEILNEVDLLPHAAISNVAVCSPPDRYEITEEMWKVIVSCCRPYVSRLIRELRVRAVVLLGEVSSFFLTRRIATGRVEERNGIFYLRTHHPARLIREPRLKSDVIAHLRQLTDKLNLTKNLEVQWRILYTEDDWRRSIRFWSSQREVAIDLEIGLPPEVPSVSEVARNPYAKVICMGIGNGSMVDVLFFRQPTEWKDIRVLGEEFVRGILKNEKLTKVFFRSSFEILWFYRLFGVIPKPFEDPMLMAHAVNENLPHYSLQFLANYYLGIKNWKLRVKEELEFLGTFDMSSIDDEVLAEYNAKDVAYTYRLYRHLLPKVDSEGVRELLRRVSYPTSVVLALAESTGIPVSLQRVQELIQKLRSEISEFERNVPKLNGLPINPRSNQQWLEYLIKVEKIPESEFPRTDKGNLSFSKEVVDTLIEKYPHISILQELRDYRLKQKLLSTYLEELPHFIIDGRVYPKFHQTGTVTGRLSCSSPPLQNFPSEKLKLGKELRTIFVAPDGWTFIEIDASQHELRVLANHSKDPNFISSFLDGADVHRSNASKIFKKPLEEITENERQLGKKLSFAVVYGASPLGISQFTKLPVDEAERLLQSMREAFPKAFEFLDRVSRTATERGVVSTLLGRKRRLPDALSRTEGARSRAMRQARNFVIQADASDWWCLVCVEWTRRALKEGKLGRVILLVHDSCVILLPESEVEWCLETFCWALRKVSEDLSLVVPIEGEYKIKKSLGDDPVEEGVVHPFRGVERVSSGLEIRPSAEVDVSEDLLLVSDTL